MNGKLKEMGPPVAFDYRVNYPIAQQTLRTTVSSLSLKAIAPVVRQNRRATEQTKLYCLYVEKFLTSPQLAQKKSKVIKN